MAAPLKFISRRSPVVSMHGAVASSQPLATEVGVRVLKAGGNAADAAVAVAACLNVTEPCSTGIGGDAFCLFYDAEKKIVRGINGSGRAPSSLTLDLLKSKGVVKPGDNHLPYNSSHSVTVPGAAAAWCDTVEQFGSGKLSMKDILQPAIDLAKQGFPVHPVAAYFWGKCCFCLKDPANKHGSDMLLNGEPPRGGDVMVMPHLATTFEELCSKGKDGFYKGRVAKAIVDVVREHGGLLSLEDLEQHCSTFDQPICTSYRGINIWEMPPNGQGITALLALNILEGFDIKGMAHNSSEYVHTVIEALSLSFADTLWYNADPSKVKVPVGELLHKDYAAKRRALIKPKRALGSYQRGSPFSGSDTVYFSVVDDQGNACSFINSNYTNFGTGLVPEGCGFTLQNRGANFSLRADHPNVLEPRKRPYHTIIPGMATRGDTGELYACFGVMGGFMQPQGHVQVLLNMIDFGMDPQEALDVPRFCISSEGQELGTVFLEEGISESVVKKLTELGHSVTYPVSGHSRSVFGRGQIIARKSAPCKTGPNRSVYWSGSDPRADGLVVGF
ncbi:uncharacterized protein LOC110048105 isoform X1 [Orbicella faveolata]|uniref:uncharacterized protein LOC110048105 isoform X1 n=1 Tax=Orbicella faveolata TaxID=48498 RepID=UPI0009E491F4|nr:uncharacterized protein LOC110048105 isoform X1 [Orbicella faveolata]